MRHLRGISAVILFVLPMISCGASVESKRSQSSGELSLADPAGKVRTTVAIQLRNSEGKPPKPDGSPGTTTVITLKKLEVYNGAVRIESASDVKINGENKPLPI